MDLNEAARLGRRLLDEHGLHDWKVVFDRAKRRAGVCRPGREEIGLSGPLTAIHPVAEVRDTILHEVAHALVGPEHGHDEVWRATALRIGCSGQRSSSVDAPRIDGDWVGTCPAGHRRTRHRRPERPSSCATCSPTFDVAHLLTWTHRGRPAAMPARLPCRAGAAADSGAALLAVAPLRSATRCGSLLTAAATTAPSGRWSSAADSLPPAGRGGDHDRAVRRWSSPPADLHADPGSAPVVPRVRRGRPPWTPPAHRPQSGRRPRRSSTWSFETTYARSAMRRVRRSRWPRLLAMSVPARRTNPQEQTVSSRRSSTTRCTPAAMLSSCHSRSPRSSADRPDRSGPDSRATCCRKAEILQGRGQDADVVVVAVEGEVVVPRHGGSPVVRARSVPGRALAVVVSHGPGLLRRAPCRATWLPLGHVRRRAA